MSDGHRNLADEKQVKDLGQKAKFRRENELADVAHVLSSPQGRRFIWRYLALCDRISADNSGSWTYFNEGERNVAIKIKTEVIEAAPDMFIKMMMESREREKNQT